MLALKIMIILPFYPLIQMCKIETFPHDLVDECCTITLHFHFQQRRIIMIFPDIMEILLLFFLGINLSNTLSLTRDAGAKFLQFYPDSQFSGHPATPAMARSGPGTGHPNTRGVECRAGRDNTFIFRSNPRFQF